MGGAAGGGYYQMATQLLSGIGQAVSQYQYGKASANMSNDIRDLLFGAANKTKDYAGQIDFANVDISPEDLIFALSNPNANPALSSAIFGSIAGLGGPTAGVLQQGSPQADLVNKLGAMGLTKAQIDRQMRLLGEGGLTKKGEVSKKLDLARTMSGYSSWDDYLNAQQSYTEQSKAMESKYAAIQDAVQSGRMSALEAISHIQEDFVAPSQEDIHSMEQRVIDQRTADINYETTQAREAALQQANVMGYNPARTIGDIEQRRLNQIYDVQQSDALERALMLLGGQQNLQSGALTSLGSSLANPLTQATQAGSVYSQGQAQMGDLALAQAQQTNQLTTEAQFFNAQQDTAENMAKIGMLLQSLGLQTQGGIMGAQADYIDATKTARAFDTFTSQYGGGGGGGGGGGSPLGFS